MPIHRQKMDDDGEEDDGRGSNVFHPSNGVVGLREVPTRNASMAMKEAAGEGLTGASVVASSKNSGNANEVGQMIVAALQQIDSVIAETGRSMETSSSSDVINANVVVDGKVNSNQPSPDNGSNAFHSLDTFEPGNTTSVKLSSSSSSDCSNSESMASDLGVLPDNQDPLTPTSPTASGSISTGDSRYTVNGGQQRSIDCTDSVASSIFVQQLSVRLAETLNRMSSPSSSVVENGGNALSVLPKPDPVVAHVLLRWLRAHDETRSPSPSMSTVSCPEYVDLQDKLHRLETDRESLSLQVSVLNEQVGAQSDKIKDLESLLDDKRRKLDSAEEMLHDELTTRSGLETDRLDLLSEISQLKLKLASLERDKISTQHRLRSAQGDIQSLQRVMQERYNELVTQAQQQQARPSPHPSAATKAPAAAVDPGELNQVVQKLRQRSKEAAGEIEHLRSAVQHLMSENAEKEQRIEQMRMLMERQLLRNPNASLNGHSVGGRSTDSDASGGSAAIPYAHRSASVGSGTMMGTSSLSNVSLVHFHQRPRAPHVNDAQQQLPVDINQQLRQLLSESDGGIIAGNLPSTSLPSSASFPETFLCTSRPPAYPSVYLHGIGGPMQPSTSCTANLSSKVNAAGVSESGSSVPAANWSAPVTPQHQQTNASTLGTAHSSTAARQLAAELNELIPQYRRSSSGVYNTGSLPRGVGQVQSPTKKRSDSCAVNSGECRPTARQPKRGLKWLLHLKATSKRSTSAPNLGRLEDDADGDECRNGAAMDSDEEGTPSRQPNEKLKREKKQKSLKTLISRLKRSNSQEFSNGDVDPGSDFRRGGFVRATAGPRLRSWSREPHAQRSIPIRPSVEQFGKWTSEEVADWLNEIGLTMYVSDCRKNVRSGRHMMALTPADMERELGIKNPLHKKKLVIAMRNIELGKPEPGDQLDYHQVLRWLDDVGLPQYRDVFAEHRIDGSSLNLLIVDDLLQMRITSALHHATIARGIQILRMVGFNLNRFIRKFNPDVISKCPLPNQVQLWSQHCITEWLRSIDLTEFTPNLMCAGIHGALMVLEPTFTAESLACVLQIPTQKTLLRRHLTTHFNQLLGQEIIAGKREALSVPFAVQLVPGLKVKAAKRGFSLARRKHNRTEVYMEPDDLVCPLTPNRKPPSSAALLERLPESISEQMLSSLSSSNV